MLKRVGNFTARGWGTQWWEKYTPSKVCLWRSTWMVRSLFVCLSVSLEISLIHVRTNSPSFSYFCYSWNLGTTELLLPWTSFKCCMVLSVHLLLANMTNVHVFVSQHISNILPLTCFIILNINMYNNKTTTSDFEVTFFSAIFIQEGGLSCKSHLIPALPDIPWISRVASDSIPNFMRWFCTKMALKLWDKRASTHISSTWPTWASRTMGCILVGLPGT